MLPDQPMLMSQECGQVLHDGRVSSAKHFITGTLLLVMLYFIQAFVFQKIRNMSNLSKASVIALYVLDLFISIR